MDINLPLQFNRLKKKRGFTIIEAFIAISILSLCVVSLLVSLNAGYNIVNDIRESIIASSVIQEEMEELRRSYFTNLPPYGKTQFSNNSLSLLCNSSGFVIVDQYIDENIVRVTLTVTWTTRLKTTKQNTKRIVTLFARNGINSI